MTGNIQAIEVQIHHEVLHYWEWFLVFGIGFVGPGYCRRGRVGVGHHPHDVVLRMAAYALGVRRRAARAGLQAAGSVGATSAVPSGQTVA
jgi:hypothetical protein